MKKILKILLIVDACVAVVFLFGLVIMEILKIAGIIIVTVILISSIPFYDKNLIIYGHNRKDGSMFSTLNNILDENWYKEYRDIIFITENATYKYQTFSVYQIPSEEYYLQTTFADDNEFQEFISTLEGRSIHKFNVDVTENDSILTLSTCGINNKYRTVLHAIRSE